MPKVSILVPVYNRERLISETLASALSQTLDDIEVLVIDNCSTDATRDVVQQIASRDSRVRFFRNDSNLGPVRNWMACVDRATAPLSKILFSDDLIAPTYLEKTAPLLGNPEISLVYTQACVGTADWQGYLMYNSLRNDCLISRDGFLRVATSLEHFTPVSPGAALFRTADLRKNILYELPGVSTHDFAQSGAGVDWLIYALTALAYPIVAYVAEPLVFFRSHPGSITIAGGARVEKAYLLAKNWLRANVDGL
jgi:glycosyltransferase involved in cell wall biosynthesis